MTTPPLDDWHEVPQTEWPGTMQGDADEIWWRGFWKGYWLCLIVINVGWIVYAMMGAR